MRSLRMTWNGPALLRLVTFAVKTSPALMLLVLLSAATPKAFVQDRDQDRDGRFGDWNLPLVYSVENTGVNFRTPDFPSFAQLPIIRPLPDPFQSADGSHDTDFSSWEHRRNDIKAAVEKYETGPKPDCHDCTITANYVPPASATANGTLTVNVTRNGKTLTLTSGVYIPQGMGNGPFPALIPMEIQFCFSFGGPPICFGPPHSPIMAVFHPASLRACPLRQLATLAPRSPHTTFLRRVTIPRIPSTSSTRSIAKEFAPAQAIRANTPHGPGELAGSSMAWRSQPIKP
jgi:hypothetical protein